MSYRDLSILKRKKNTNPGFLSDVHKVISFQRLIFVIT